MTRAAPRKVKVEQGIARGESEAQIAARLGITVRQVGRVRCAMDSACAELDGPATPGQLIARAETARIYSALVREHHGHATRPPRTVRLERYRLARATRALTRGTAA